MPIRLRTIIIVTAIVPLAAQTPPNHPEVVDSGSLKLLHRSGLVYPREARAKHIEGTIVLDVAVNEEGLVTDARVLSGPEELRKAALQNVLNWHYARPEAPTHVQVRLDFQAPASRPKRALPLGIIKAFENDGSSLPAAVWDNLLARLKPLEGQQSTSEIAAQISDIVDTVEPHAVLTYRADEGRNITIALRLEGVGAPGAPGSVSPAAFPSTEGMMRIRVGGLVMAAKLIQNPPPVYPPLAKQARIQGVVRLEALVGPEGEVKALRVVNGHPLLTQAALEAVRQWTYQPTLLNGKPVEVQTTVDVNFTLAE